MLQILETYLWWAIRKNGNNDFRRYVSQSWTQVNQWWSLVRQVRCQKQVVTFVPATKCNGYLITGYMASGVKLAAIWYGLFCGTSEVVTNLSNRKGGNGRQGMWCCYGGRLSCSSDEVTVMETERRTKLVWFQNNLQPAMEWLITTKQNHSQSPG